MRPMVIAFSRGARRDENHSTTTSSTSTFSPLPPPTCSPSPSSTPSVLSSSSHASLARPRQPLHVRDGNVIMRVPQNGAPLSSRSVNASNMPYDNKQQQQQQQHPSNNHGSRPLMPTIGRTAKTTPLTPRVAAAPRPLATPLRRDAHPTVATTPSAHIKDDFATPASTLLNSNVTPRSSSRKSRVDSTNTTPSSTPGATPNASSQEFHRGAAEGSLYAPGLGTAEPPKRLTVSFDPVPTERREQNDVSKFFYASDAKSAPPRQPKPLQKASTFFYANGSSIPSTNHAVTAPTGGDDRSHPKFFHANGTPETHTGPQLTKKPSSILSTSSHGTGRLGNIPPPLQTIPQQRPVSPTKIAAQLAPSSLRRSPPHPSPTLRPAVGRGQTAPAGPATRSSIGSPRSSLGHTRSISITSLDGSQPRSASQVTSIESASPVLAPQAASKSLAAAIVSTTLEVEDHPEESEDAPRSVLASPTKAGDSLEHLNDLAANARRERKVLDLEITNSSLAAINRTLEREMRKQAAELRRYKRLSRAGRLSIAPTESATIQPSADSVLSDMSEEEEESEEDLEDTEESEEDGSLSPTAMAAVDERRRKRDEKRLQLDLSKHQQLLVDSQKMNESLKRCLGWTEELIKEGNKALAYSVRVSDVQLGGRVLAPEEVEEMNQDEPQHPDGAEPLAPSTRDAIDGIYALVDEVWGSDERPPNQRHNTIQ